MCVTHHYDDTRPCSSGIINDGKLPVCGRMDTAINANDQCNGFIRNVNSIDRQFVENTVKYVEKRLRFSENSNGRDTTVYVYYE